MSNIISSHTSELAPAPAARGFDTDRDDCINRIRFSRSCLFTVMELTSEINNIAKHDTDLENLTAFVEGVIQLCEVAANSPIRVQNTRLQQNLYVSQCLFSHEFQDEDALVVYLNLLAKSADRSEKIAAYVNEMSAWLETDIGVDAMNEDMPGLVGVAQIKPRMMT